MTITTEAPRIKRGQLAAGFVTDLVSQVRRGPDPDIFGAVYMMLHDTAAGIREAAARREHASPRDLLAKPLGHNLDDRRAAKMIYAGLLSMEKASFRPFLEEMPVLLARFETAEEPLLVVIDGHQRVRMSLQYELGSIPVETRERYPMLNGVSFVVSGREITADAGGRERSVAYIRRPLEVETAVRLLTLRGATVSVTD